MAQPREPTRDRINGRAAYGAIGMRWQDRSIFELALFSLRDEIADKTNIHAILNTLRKLYELKTVAYLGFSMAVPTRRTPYLAVTYSDDWVDYYKQQRFIEIDPVVQIGFCHILPIDWQEFDRSHCRVRRMFGEAIEFGLGRHGISLPIYDKNGDRALVSITSDVSDREWHRLRLYYMRDFHLLALHLHQAILRLENHTEEGVRLSPRERECLLWVAEGKTAWETAIILGLSEHTVRCYLENARHKLGAANNTHAVNKAAKANLLAQLP